MAQEAENFVKQNDVVNLIPTASVDINPGDVLVMSRRNDPVSLALITGTAGRVRPLAAAFHGQWLAGVADGKFTSAIVGATDYATPTAQNALRVVRRGIFRLAVSDTAGQAGDFVRYSSGASAAQVFIIDNRRPGWAVGRIFKTFSGASANDPQYVELIEIPMGGPNLYHWLENRVVEGCTVLASAQPASRVRIGLTQSTVSGRNIIIIQNRAYSHAARSIAFGGVGSLAASTVRFKWVVARSGSNAVRSGSGTKAALASFTVAGVTVGLLAPVTMTAAEIPIALLIQFSAANQSAAHIINLRGPNRIPRVGSWGV